MRGASGPVRAVRASTVGGGRRIGRAGDAETGQTGRAASPDNLGLLVLKNLEKVYGGSVAHDSPFDRVNRVGPASTPFDDAYSPGYP